MRHRELLISEDKETIGIIDANGKKHWWSRSKRVRMTYTWGTDMAPLVDVSAVAFSSESPLSGCNCGITDGKAFYCVGSYGGCERFNNREGRV